MSTSKVKQIHDFGQSIWLDFIDRKIIFSGEAADTTCSTIEFNILSLVRC